MNIHKEHPPESGDMLAPPEWTMEMVQEGVQQTRAVTEAAEDGPLADVRCARHRLHRDPGRAVLGDQTGGGVQQPGPVAGRVGAQTRLVARRTELQQLRLGGALLGLGTWRQHGGHDASVKHRE